MTSLDLALKREAYARRRSDIAGHHLVTEAFPDVTPLFSWNKGPLIQRVARSLSISVPSSNGATVSCATGGSLPYGRPTHGHQEELDVEDKKLTDAEDKAFGNMTKKRSVGNNKSQARFVDDLPPVISKLHYRPPQQDSFEFVKKLCGLDLSTALVYTDEVCYMCKEGGNLIACEHAGCGKSFHTDCYDRKMKIPKGKWFCRAHHCWDCESTSNLGNPCIICAKNFCSKHVADKKKSNFVSDICNGCVKLLQEDSDWLRFHLFAFHFSINNIDYLNAISAGELKRHNLERFFQVTDKIQDSDIDDESIWKNIACIPHFSHLKPAVLKDLYIHVVLPYKKFFTNPIPVRTPKPLSPTHNSRTAAPVLTDTTNVTKIILPKKRKSIQANIKPIADEDRIPRKPRISSILDKENATEHKHKLT
jgi:hypothetical protein